MSRNISSPPEEIQLAMMIDDEVWSVFCVDAERVQATNVYMRDRQIQVRPGTTFRTLVKVAELVREYRTKDG